MSNGLRKVIISVKKQPVVEDRRIDIYAVAFLFVDFSTTAGGVYEPVSDHVIYVPKPTPKQVPDLVPPLVFNTSASMYKTLFSGRTPLNDIEVAGYTRGQILSLLIASGLDKPENTRFIGLEAFADINLLVKNRLLLYGDYSESFIDLKSSFETLVEVKQDVNKDKQKLLETVMDKGVIPNHKTNPKEADDPLYECYQCLKIYNGMLLYGRMSLK